MKPTFTVHVYRILATAAIVTLASGTVVYHYVERLSWVDAYYFSVITLATVGYGDIVPQTTFGKIFTTFYIFAGVGIITSFISYTLQRRAHRIEKRYGGHDKKQHPDNSEPE